MIDNRPYYRVIVAGSRTFTDYSYISYMLNLLDGLIFHINTVVSGCARGPDTAGIHWAEEHLVDIVRCPANWDKYGKSAGYRRNEEMLKYADALIAFWDKQSRGTKHMIDLGRAHLKSVIIVYSSACFDVINSEASAQR